MLFWVVTISSVDSVISVLFKSRVHSLLLKIDLTPDTKKISLPVIHVLLVLASVKWGKLELEEESVKNPS